MATLWCTRYVTRPRLRLLEKRDTEYKFIQVLSLSFSLSLSHSLYLSHSFSFSLPVSLSSLFFGEKELKELKFLSVNSLEMSSSQIDTHQ